MTAVVMSALGSALGVVGVIIALRPAPPSLRAALIELERAPVTTARSASLSERPLSVRVDRHLAAKLAVVATKRDYVRVPLWPLLTITGTSIQELCGEIILGGSVGLVLPGVWWVVITAGGVHLPFAVPLWASFAMGSCGGLLPVLVLRSRARKAKRSARRAVGSFLNLVVLCLAGGMGIEGALHAASGIGGDAVTEQIRSALVLAQDAGEPPWEALDDLGRRLGVTELTELAAAVGLAGAEGARIRLTLTAKANSIRRHELAEAESEANAVTERLLLPGVFLLVGFLLFIAYPAVSRISAGL